jgi:hypothetical protein
MFGLMQADLGLMCNFFRGENLGVSDYFFCLDTKKVTKKNQGCHLR